MPRLAVVAAALAFFAVSWPAGAQQVLLEESGPAIEIQVTVDPRILEVRPVIDAIRADADTLVAEHRGYADEDFAERGTEAYWNSHYLAAAYEITFMNDAVASVIASIETYSGGAHGNQGFAAINIDIASGEPFGADALFGDFSGTSQAFQAIQAFARERLAFERSERLDIPDMPPEDLYWVNDGTETPDHLSVFTIIENDAGAGAAGLRLYFAPYQVGAYVEGSYTVEVPALVFADYLTPDFAPLFN